MSQPLRHDPYAALRIPNFRWFVASLMAMTVATQRAHPRSTLARPHRSGRGLFGGAVALLPVFAAEILHVGPEGLGVLRAAPAVGAVLMSLMLAHLPPLRRAGPALLISVAVFGLSIIGFGLSRDFLLSIALLAVSGMSDTVSVVIRSTLLQVLTPAHLLGRVASVNAIFIGSSNEIGAFESGTAARLIGTVPSVVLGGLATLVVVAITAVKVPQLRRLREIR